MPLDASNTEWAQPQEVPAILLPPAPDGRAQLALGLDLHESLRPKKKRPRRAKLPPAPQLALHLDDHACTPLMLRVEATLRRLANALEPTPSYEMLNTLAGGQNRSSVFRAAQRLAGMGRLLIQQEPTRRRIVLLFTGAATQWAPFRPGHSPRPKKRKKITNRSLTKTLIPGSRHRSSGLGLLPPPVDPASRAPIASTKECAFPLWGDHEKPTHRYCNAETVRGKNWCAMHLGGVQG